MRSMLSLVLSAAVMALSGCNAPESGTPAEAKSAPVAALQCEPGKQICSGPFGAQCFDNAAGQTCHKGWVCPAGETACVGQYGQGCYRPESGQSCAQGLICPPGQPICVRNGKPECGPSAAADSGCI